MAKMMDSVAIVCLAIFAAVMLLAHTILMTPFDLRRILVYGPMAVFGAMAALSTKPRVRAFAPVLVALTIVLVFFCINGEERHRLEMKAFMVQMTNGQFREAIAKAREEGRQEGIAEARKTANSSEAVEPH